MTASASEVVILRYGVSVMLPALQLAWALEQRGCILAVDEDGHLIVKPRALLAEADRVAIREWRDQLKVIAEYSRRPNFEERVV